MTASFRGVLVISLASHVLLVGADVALTAPLAPGPEPAADAASEQAAAGMTAPDTSMSQSLQTTVTAQTNIVIDPELLATWQPQIRLPLQIAADCDESLRQDFIGQTYKGDDLYEFIGVPTFEECIGLCLLFDNPPCWSVAHRFLEGRCWLKSVSVQEGDLEADGEINVSNVEQCTKPAREANTCTEPELAILEGQDFLGTPTELIYVVDALSVKQPEDCVDLCMPIPECLTAVHLAPDCPRPSDGFCCKSCVRDKGRCWLRSAVANIGGIKPNPVLSTLDLSGCKEV